jgi:hypothetical protein
MPRYYLNNFFTARARAQASQLTLQAALIDMTQGCARDNRDHVDVDARIHLENNAVHSGQMYPSYLTALTDTGYEEKK